MIIKGFKFGMFLKLIAGAGSFTKTFLSAGIIKILNVLIGLLLIYFGLRMISRKT